MVRFEGDFERVDVTRMRNRVISNYHLRDNKVEESACILEVATRSRPLP